MARAAPDRVGRILFESGTVIKVPRALCGASL